mmetsp:Transcript_57963/g.107072  ORF Transcript_57963/g.107072 Transcript_57963/m.107072 type:complete len:215 (+) Transcript_57963:438-1082(+)
MCWTPLLCYNLVLISHLWNPADSDQCLLVVRVLGKALSKKNADQALKAGKASSLKVKVVKIGEHRQIVAERALIEVIEVAIVAKVVEMLTTETLIVTGAKSEKWIKVGEESQVDQVEKAVDMWSVMCSPDTTTWVRMICETHAADAACRHPSAWWTETPEGRGQDQWIICKQNPCLAEQWDVLHQEGGLMWRQARPEAISSLVHHRCSLLTASP